MRCRVTSVCFSRLCMGPTDQSVGSDLDFLQLASL
jgi:hypothetical protein